MAHVLSEANASRKEACSVERDLVSGTRIDAKINQVAVRCIVHSLDGVLQEGSEVRVVCDVVGVVHIGKPISPDENHNPFGNKILSFSLYIV